MRIGRMRHHIEIWNTTIKVNQFGVNEETKELFLSCPAAIDDSFNESVGQSNKSLNTTIKFTIRFNRYFKAPNNSMYIRWDNREFDIIHHNNHHSLDRYITLTAVARSK